MKKELLLILLILLIGCSTQEIELETNDTQLNQTEEINETEIKEAKYSEALKEVADDNTIKIDKRYNALKKQIDNILLGKDELKMAAFTRIKIELDYLFMQGYDAEKINLLQDNFKKAFSEAEKIAEEDTLSGSLNDRYYTLNSRIERISPEEAELKVADYLKIENGLNDLEQDDYLPSRIADLRNKLLKAVIAELESAVLHFEIPEIEEEIIEEEVVEDLEEIVEEPIKYVNLVDGGFAADAIIVRINDTVVWQNARTGRYKMALVIGNRECRNVKSRLFHAGESFNATFTEPGTCWISDGIYTTQAMRVIVSS